LRVRLKSAKKQSAGPKSAFYSPFRLRRRWCEAMPWSIAVPLFIVANPAGLCHKRNLIARLIKGCRVDVRAGCFIRK